MRTSVHRNILTQIVIYFDFHLETKNLNIEDFCVISSLRIAGRTRVSRGDLIDKRVQGGAESGTFCKQTTVICFLT